MILKLPKKAQRHVKNESQQRFDVVLTHPIQKTKKQDKKIGKGERMPNPNRSTSSTLCSHGYP